MIVTIDDWLVIDTTKVTHLERFSDNTVKIHFVGENYALATGNLKTVTEKVFGNRSSGERILSFRKSEEA